MPICIVMPASADRVRNPCAIVVLAGLSRAARSTSTWIHWWSPVASANWSILSWPTANQPDPPSFCR
jgi:hypothetical protein